MWDIKINDFYTNYYSSFISVSVRKNDKLYSTNGCEQESEM